ncbi:MAG: hypothetical protein NT178_04710, partial [Proteobacteria bacterium]|nr:hypothetical protein [Pseudomonadota bacterium]
LHLFYETGENPEGTNLHNEDMLRTNTGLGSKGIRATGRKDLTPVSFSQKVKSCKTAFILSLRE